METDIELAERVARRAGKLLVELRAGFGPVDLADRAQVKQLKDQADRASHEMIAQELGNDRPGDAVLSEEGRDEAARDTADRVWIVDPLDGTSEFGQGRSDFAVHIALWRRDDTDRLEDGQGRGSLLLGVVDLPAQGRCATSADSVNWDPRHVAGRRVRMVVSRSRPPRIVDDSQRLGDVFRAAGIDTPGVELLNVGSVGAKVGEILADRADLYVHDSGFYEWDVAAPLAVARHYGLTACHLDGSEITFNHRPPWVRDLVVGKPELVAAIRPALTA